LARDNYGFQKRQRELAKKKKKEEKRQRKLAKQDPDAAENPEATGDETPVSEGQAKPEASPQSDAAGPTEVDPVA